MEEGEEEKEEEGESAGDEVVMMIAEKHLEDLMGGLAWLKSDGTAKAVLWE